MREIGQRFRRCLGAIRSLEPGEYCVASFETMSGIERVTHVRCLECGGIDILDARYTVLPYSGLVTPRWSCPTETCGYRERLTLDAWGEP